MICISLADLTYTKISKILKHNKYLFELRLDLLNLNEKQISKLININKNIIITDKRKSLKLLVKYIKYGASFVDIDLNKIDISTNKYKNNLIISYHNYKTTPKHLNLVLKKLMKNKAVFYKISTKTNSIADNLSLLDAAAINNNLIVQGMGKKATLFRTFSPIVYSYYKIPTAEGQLNYKNLEKIIKLFKAYFKTI